MSAPISQNNHVVLGPPQQASVEAWSVRGRAVACWSDVPLRAVTTDQKPTAFWYALKTHDVVIDRVPEDHLPRFGLSLVLGVPTGARVRLSGVLKCLLDGVISAFHAHNGSLLGEHGQRIGQILDVDAAIVAALLQDRNMAILGTRSLLGARSQWNPAADHCVAAEVFIQPNMGTEYRLSGRMFELQDAANP